MNLKWNIKWLRSRIWNIKYHIFVISIEGYEDAERQLIRGTGSKANNMKIYPFDDSFGLTVEVMHMHSTNKLLSTPSIAFLKSKR